MIFNQTRVHNSGSLRQEDDYSNEKQQDQIRQGREERLARRKMLQQEGFDDPVSNTISGRVYKRPNYLKDYDESGKHHVESDEEDFNENDQSEDEDDSGDDYVDKKY